jgi:TPR repeat protein
MCFSCLPCCKRKNYVQLRDQAYNASPEAIKLYEKARSYAGKRDWVKYIDCLKQSAELGLADAECEFGSKYLDGFSGPADNGPGIIYYLEKDRAKGRQWIQKAADQDDAIAKQYLKFLANWPDDKGIPVRLQQGNIIIFSTEMTGLFGND